jgi:hypothetical protein
MLRRVFLASVIVVCGLVVAVATPALGQDPGTVTVPAEPSGGGAPNPDPAPAPSPSPPPPSSPPPSAPPPSSQPPPSSEPSSPSEPAASPPASRPNPTPPPQVAPTPGELATVQQEQAQRAAALRHHRATLEQIRADTKRESREGYGIPGKLTWPATSKPRVDSAQSADGTVLDSALDPTLPPPVQPADLSSGSTSSRSLLSGAGPVLFGLLAVVILVVGIAVVPRRWRTSGGFTAVVSHHRVELGLVGATLLAAGLIALLIALLSR